VIELAQNLHQLFSEHQEKLTNGQPAYCTGIPSDDAGQVWLSAGLVKYAG
jgi:hypothetical protein